jgi:spore germination cell wall hydrolase CwlJ-like protein
MAMNIYYEAAYEPLVSQMGVALVTMNRAHQNPKNICHVVYKYKQFSWTNDQSILKPPHGKQWKRAIALAKAVIYGRPLDFTRGATHFYASYIKPPKWSKHMTFVGLYGTHLFLRDDNGDAHKTFRTNWHRFVRETQNRYIRGFIWRPGKWGKISQYQSCSGFQPQIS